LKRLHLIVNGASQVGHGHLDFVKREVEDLLALLALPVAVELEVWMVETLFSGVSCLGVVNEHIVQQIQCLFAGLSNI